jgi:transposase
MMPRRKRKFSKEFKAEAAELVVSGGQSASQVARSHDIAPSLVANWVRQARVDAGDNPRLLPTSNEREELIRLRKREKDLEMELSFLKKTASYFASLKR